MTEEKQLTIMEINFILYNHPDNEVKEKAGKKKIEILVQEGDVEALAELARNDKLPQYIRELAGKEAIKIYVNHEDSSKALVGEDIHHYRNMGLMGMTINEEYPSSIRDLAGKEAIKICVSRRQPSFYLGNMATNKEAPIDIRKLAGNSLLELYKQDGNYWDLPVIVKFRDYLLPVRNLARERMDSKLEGLVEKL